MTWETAIKFIPPAVAISILAFFVRFFGKAIVDQMPYFDSRDWAIELNGSWFLVDFLAAPTIIAIAVLFHFKTAIIPWFGQVSGLLSPISYHWINLVVVFLISLYYSQASRTLTKKIYKIPPTGPAVPEEKQKRAFDLIRNANAALLQPSVVVLAFVFGVEALSGDPVWISVFAAQMFITLIGLALNYSLMRTNLPVVSIRFSDGTQPLQDVTLLKVNQDNIRLRDGNRVLVLNKNAVSEIEFVDAKQKSGTSHSLISVMAWIPWLFTFYSLWEHRLVLGLLLGVFFPLLLLTIATFIFGASPSARKTASVPKFNSWDGFLNYVESLPLPVKVMAVFYSLASVGAVFGAIGAWNHNLGLFLALGVVIPFIAWAAWQIIAVTRLAETIRDAEGKEDKIKE